MLHSPQKVCALKIGHFKEKDSSIGAKLIQSLHLINAHLKIKIFTKSLDSILFLYD